MDANFFKIFMLIIVSMVVLRLYEMNISKTNEKKLLETFHLKLLSPFEHYFVYLFHLCWFISLIVEALFVHRVQDGLTAVMCYLFLTIAQIIRFESMQALGMYWTTKIYHIPSNSIVSKGLYKYFAHPSYLAVVIEFLVLPLLFNAHYTLMIFSILNLLILLHRIKLEAKITGRVL